MLKVLLLKLVYILVVLGAGLIVLRMAQRERTRPGGSLKRVVRSWPFAVLVVLVTVGAGFTYIRYIEPNWIMVTRLRVTHDGLAQALGKARVVQLADLHIERVGMRERALVARVNAYRPDWIVITGDLINDRKGWVNALEVISRLRAKQGIWVVPGNTDNAHLDGRQFAVDLESERGRHTAALARIDALPKGVKYLPAWMVQRGDILAAAGHRKEARRAYAAALNTIEKLNNQRRSARAVTALEARLRQALAEPIDSQ